MRFSIIIPVYNKANSIGKTLESVLSQSNSDYEIIVVDDGSEDELMTVLNPFADKIRLIRQRNAGVSVARNRGIEESTGEYVCFLDADDTWLPNHLAVINDAIEKTHAPFLSTMYISAFADGRTVSKLSLLPYDKEILILDDYFKLVLNTSSTIIHTDTVCVRRDILSQMKFEPGEKIGEDTDLWYRIAAYYPLVLIKKETAVYNRELSTATKAGNNNLDWCFAKREKILTQDSSIPKSKRRHISKLIDRWRLTCCRQLLALNKRTEAFNYLMQLRYYIQLRSIFCVALFCLPNRINRKIIENY